MIKEGMTPVACRDHTVCPYLTQVNLAASTNPDSLPTFWLHVQTNGSDVSLLLGLAGLFPFTNALLGVMQVICYWNESTPALLRQISKAQRGRKTFRGPVVVLANRSKGTMDQIVEQEV